MFSPLLASLAFLSLPLNIQTAETSDGSVKSGYRHMSETDMFYKEHNTATNWSEAIAACKAEGGQLATPFTKDEALAITLLFTCKTFCSWLGIHDSDTEGTFVTLNGTLARNIYMKWQKGEPNNAGGQEDCVCMKKDGTYNDVPCDWVNTFMCTKQRHEVETSDIVDTDKALQDALKDYQYAPENKWHYKVHKEPKIWLDAVATCRAEGAQLVAPTTEKEVQAIASLHNSGITFFTWVGLHDSLAEGYFTTLDGTPAADVYTRWTPGEPNDFGGCEDCVAMSKAGIYNDGPCHWNNTFICIKRLSEINRNAATPPAPTAGVDVSSMHSPNAGCPLPDYPYKGKYTVSNYNKKIIPGDMVQQFTILLYSCNINFDLSEKFSVCQEDNIWSSSPECYERCDMITSHSLEFFCFSPAGTSIPCSPQLSSDSTIQSKCKEGHLATEPLEVLTCHNGIWDKRTPKCKPDCGLEKGLGISHVVNGFTAKKDTFPWHVAVYQDMNDNFEQICGGSLIESHIVLSDVLKTSDRREECEKTGSSEEFEKAFTTNRKELEQSVTSDRKEMRNLVTSREDMEKTITTNREELEKSIKRNREELEKSVKRNREELEKSVKRNREELEKSITRNIKELENMDTRNSEGLVKTITRLREELEKLVTRDREILEKMVTKIREEFEKAATRNREELEKTITSNREDLEEAIKRNRN